MIKQPESDEVLAIVCEQIIVIRTTKGNVKCKFAKFASESKSVIGV